MLVFIDLLVNGDIIRVWIPTMGKTLLNDLLVYLYNNPCLNHLAILVKIIMSRCRQLVVLVSVYFEMFLLELVIGLLWRFLIYPHIIIFYIFFILNVSRGVLFRLLIRVFNCPLIVFQIRLIMWLWLLVAFLDLLVHIGLLRSTSNLLCRVVLLIVIKWRIHLVWLFSDSRVAWLNHLRR